VFVLRHTTKTEKQNEISSCVSASLHIISFCEGVHVDNRHTLATREKKEDANEVKSGSHERARGKTVRGRDVHARVWLIHG
jgi:hypothetical protein